MNNRECLSDEDFCAALEQIDCRLCAFYGNCKGKQCRDGFVVWLKKEHEEDGKEADYKCSEVYRDGERGQKQLPKPE